MFSLIFVFFLLPLNKQAQQKLLNNDYLRDKEGIFRVGNPLIK